MLDDDLTRRRIGRAVYQNPALSRAGLQERIFGRLFTGLVYAQIWEDPVADMAGLALGPADRVVCIASGGCNLMSYLTAGPAAITAVDLSPAHVALVRLKLAAVTALPDHAAFYDLFGYADRPGNPALYDRYIAPLLDADSRAWWETRRGLRGRRIDMFARGFYRHGALGRFIAAMHLVSRLGGVDYRPLLAARSLDDQRAFFDANLAPLFDNRLVKALARRPSALFALGIPPAQFDKLAADGGGDIVPVLRARMRKLICDFPVGENYFAWAAFDRGYRADGTGPVPPYLEAANFAAVRDGAPRAQVDHAALTDRAGLDDRRAARRPVGRDHPHRRPRRARAVPHRRRGRHSARPCRPGDPRAVGLRFRNLRDDDGRRPLRHLWRRASLSAGGLSRWPPPTTPR